MKEREPVEREKREREGGSMQFESAESYSLLSLSQEDFSLEEAQGSFLHTSPPYVIHSQL